MKTVNVLLIIGGVLIAIPLLLLVIAATTYHGHTSVAQEELSLRVQRPAAEKLLAERVMQDYHYRAYGGHDLRLVSLSRPGADRCQGLWRDYYNNGAVYESCYEGVFTFAVNSSAPANTTYYTARTWLLGSETKGFEITEHPTPFSMVHDYESCLRAGGVIVEPECEGCEAGCEDGSGIIYHQG